jgi:hypothetical protein
MQRQDVYVKKLDLYDEILLQHELMYAHDPEHDIS